jgi:glycosyltransferase involved in cell wall biosynthesis
MITGAYNGKPPKPAVLLVPNVSWWVLGSMAMEIARVGSRTFDFYLMTESLLAKRPDLSRYLFARVSMIHALNETGVEHIRRVAPSPQQLPPLITWIHHVTRWSGDHEAAAKHSQLITACTEDWANRIRSLCPHPIEICVVPHGVDRSFFRRAPRQRESYGIPADAFAVGFIASADSNKDDNRKGLDTCLRVAAAAGKRIGNLHFSFVGPGWDQAAATLLASGISANVVDHLPKCRLPGFYSSIDAYLMTSRVEGGPCTVLEAMACETPVAATRVGLVPSVIVDGVNGYSTDCDDVDGLVDALERLASSESHRRELGARARTAVSNRSWCTALQPAMQLYGSLSAGPTATRSDVPPRWFGHPERFARAACAADVLLWLWRGVRTRKLTIRTALRKAPVMLEGAGARDIARGVGLLTGVAFRTPGWCRTMDLAPRLNGDETKVNRGASS